MLEQVVQAVIVDIRPEVANSNQYLNNKFHAIASSDPLSSTASFVNHIVQTIFLPLTLVLHSIETALWSFGNVAEGLAGQQSGIGERFIEDWKAAGYYGLTTLTLFITLLGGTFFSSMRRPLATTSNPCGDPQGNDRQQRVQHQYTQLTEQVNALRTQVDQLTAQISEKDDRISQLTREQEGAISQNNELQTVIDGRESELNIAHAEIVRLREQTPDDQSQAEIARLTASIAILNERLEQTRGALASQATDSSQQLEAKQEKIDQLQTEVAQLQIEVARLQGVIRGDSVDDDEEIVPVENRPLFNLLSNLNSELLIEDNKEKLGQLVTLLIKQFKTGGLEEAEQAVINDGTNFFLKAENNPSESENSEQFCKMAETLYNLRPHSLRSNKNMGQRVMKMWTEAAQRSETASHSAVKKDDDEVSIQDDDDDEVSISDDIEVSIPDNAKPLLGIFSNLNPELLIKNNAEKLGELFALLIRKAKGDPLEDGAEEKIQAGIAFFLEGRDQNNWNTDETFIRKSCQFCNLRLTSLVPRYYELMGNKVIGDYKMAVWETK